MRFGNAVAHYDTSQRAQLFLLGEPLLLGSDGRPVPLPPKAFGLAAAIALSRPAAMARSAAAELLWGSTERRQGNLRKLLWTVRSMRLSIGTSLFACDKTTIRLADARDLVVDVAQVQRHIEAPTTDGLPDLCRLYRGDLLDNLPIDAPDFGDWIGVQRVKLRDALLTTAGRHLAAGADDLDPVLRRCVAERIIEIDPYNETACRVLMRLRAEDGEAARVRDLFRSLEARLAGDLSAAPSEATIALFHSLTAEKEETDSPAVVLSLPYATGRSRRFPLNLPDGDDGGVPSLSVSPDRSLYPSEEAGLVTAVLDGLELSLHRSRSLRLLAPPGSGIEPQGHRTTGADYLVDATASALDDDVAITVRLIDAESRAIVWSDQTRLRRCDPRSGVDLLAAALSAGILGQIERTELAAVAPDRVSAPYHWFLLGKACLMTMDLPSVRRGRRAFKTALDKHPNFSQALGGLAWAFQLEWLLLARDEQDLLNDSVGLARAMIEIDPLDWSGHRALGFVNLFGRAYEASLDAYEKADRLNPHHPSLLIEHALALAFMGDLAAAQLKIAEATRLNPVPSDHHLWAAASTHYLSGAYRKVIEAGSAMRSPSVAYRLMAASHARLGERETARRVMRKVIEIHPDFSVDRFLRASPIRDRALAQFCAEGLRLAGFE